MSLYVQKFGGTSVGDTDRIGQVADKVAAFRAAGHELVVVVSAMSGETNRLIELAHEVQERPVLRELDVLLCHGVMHVFPLVFVEACATVVIHQIVGGSLDERGIFTKCML